MTLRRWPLSVVDPVGARTVLIGDDGGAARSSTDPTPTHRVARLADVA